MSNMHYTEIIRIIHSFTTTEKFLQRESKTEDTEELLKQIHSLNSDIETLVDLESKHQDAITPIVKSIEQKATNLNSTAQQYKESKQKGNT